MANFAGQATVRIPIATSGATHHHRATVGDAAASPVSGSSNQPFEMAAGQTVTIHTVSNAAAGSAGDDTLDVWVAVYEDNSNVQALAEVLVLNNVGFNIGSTLRGQVDFTAPKAGTYRIRIRARFDANGSTLAGGYLINSDTTAATRYGTAPLWAANTSESSPGYIRSGLSITAVDVDNTAAFDGPPAPFAWPDTVRLRATASVGAVANSSSLVIDADTLNGTTPVRDSEITASTSGTTWNDAGGTVQLDKTDPTSFGIQIGPPANSTLSGRPWTHFEAAPGSWTLGAVDGGSTSTKSVSFSRQSFLSWDGRITVDHHMQLNNNVFNAALDTTSRLTSDLAFVTFTLLNARNEPQTGITVTETLQDSQALTAAVINQSVATGANGRPASMSSWSASLPGGGWLHTVDITSPAGLTDTEINPVATFTLLAPNSAYSVLCSAGGATDGQHFNQGDDFIAGGGLVDGVTGQLLTPSGSPCVIIARQSDSGHVEYLDATFAWNPLAGNEQAYCHIMTASDLIIPGADPRVFLFIVPASVGVIWGLSGISCLFRLMDAAGTPYIGQASVFVSGGNNKHSGHAFDPIGLFK